jgi:hypothetical protein
MTNKNWMKDAFANAGKGLLHRQLGIPKGEKIPEVLLRAIMRTKIDKICHNPTPVGNRLIRVTSLVKHRVNPLLTADRINDKKRK